MAPVWKTEKKIKPRTFDQRGNFLWEQRVNSEVNSLLDFYIITDLPDSRKKQSRLKFVCDHHHK
jgi:hypothetical protein